MKQAIYKANEKIKNDFLNDKGYISLVVSYENEKTGERVVQPFAGKNEDNSKLGGSTNNQEWGIFLKNRYAYVKYELNWTYKDTTICFSESSKENIEIYQAWKEGKSIKDYKMEKEVEKEELWF